MPTKDTIIRMNFDRNIILLAGLTALGTSLLLGVAVNPGFWQGDLLNPDSAMRLARLRDILQAGAPLDAVMRDGSGAGTVLHWSHLLDSLLLALAAPIAAFTGWPRALPIAGALAGPLSMAALAVALAWATAPFADRQWRWLPALLICCATPVVSYGLPGVVHHHVLLAAIAVMTAGWAVRIIRTPDAPQAGIALGAWAGAAVWLSPESMPLSLMALCGVWLAWLLRPRALLARRLAECGVAMLAVILAAWLADPPGVSRWAAQQDRLSVVYLTLAAAAAACGIAAHARLPRLAVLALGGALAAAWLAAFPAMLQGTYGLLPPEAAHLFLDGIAEMQPVNTIAPVISFLLPAAIAAAALAVAAWLLRSPLLLYAAGCAGLLVAGGAEHVRFATYPAVLAAGLAPVLLTVLGRTRFRAAGLATILLLPLANTVTAMAGDTADVVKSCSMHGIEALLAPYAGQIVLSGVGDTPDLLWRTQVLTVGSLYHRNPEGFLRLRAAWRSPSSDTMPAAVQATGARLVLVCPGAKLSGFMKGAPTPNLASSLQAGEPPAWLHRIGAIAPHGFVLYAADPPGPG